MLEFIFCLLVFSYFGMFFIKNKKYKFLFILFVDFLILIFLFLLNYKNNLIFTILFFIIINFIFYSVKDDFSTLKINVGDFVFTIINVIIILYFLFFIIKDLSKIKSFTISEYEIFFLFVLLIAFSIFTYYVLTDKIREKDV